MKYMQNGNFQNQSLMKLTIIFTLVFLVGFWITNFAMYFAKMGMTPESVQAYYLGSEEAFTMPRTYQSMLEVTHGHLAMQALVILFITHLLIFAPYSKNVKIAFVACGFSFALLNEAASWLVRFVDPGFSILKVFAFMAFQSTLGFLILALLKFLLVKPNHAPYKMPDISVHQAKAEKEKTNVTD